MENFWKILMNGTGFCLLSCLFVVNPTTLICLFLFSANYSRIPLPAGSSGTRGGKFQPDQWDDTAHHDHRVGDLGHGRHRGDHHRGRGRGAGRAAGGDTFDHPTSVVDPGVGHAQALQEAHHRYAATSDQRHHAVAGGRGAAPWGTGGGECAGGPDVRQQGRHAAAGQSVCRALNQQIWLQHTDVHGILRHVRVNRQ